MYTHTYKPLRWIKLADLDEITRYTSQLMGTPLTTERIASIASLVKSR